MSRSSHILAASALALTTLVATGLARAQVPASSYPYWGSAPSSYHGTSMRSPGSVMPPNGISSAARPPSGYGSGHEYPGGTGAGVGGGDTSPTRKMQDSRSRMAGSNQVGPDNKAHIWLRVPEDATVWVDGVKTKQTGEARHFYSPPLTPGKKYTYKMRVRWEKDGEPVEKTQKIAVHAGANVRLDLTRPQSNEE
jgi:uncharacterized protein (TIGR03000 family)